MHIIYAERPWTTCNGVRYSYYELVLWIFIQEGKQTGEEEGLVFGDKDLEGSVLQMVLFA